MLKTILLKQLLKILSSEECHHSSWLIYKEMDFCITISIFIDIIIIIIFRWLLWQNQYLDRRFSTAVLRNVLRPAIDWQIIYLFSERSKINIACRFNLLNDSLNRWNLSKFCYSIEKPRQVELDYINSYFDMTIFLVFWSYIYF